MHDKIFRFYATTIGGLEDVVLDDVRRELKSLEKVRFERGGRLGRIFFHYERSPRHLLGLNSTLGMFALVAEIFGITVGGPAIEYLARKIGALDLEPVRRLARACSAASDICKYDLNITLQGNHRFTAHRLRRAVREVMEGQHGLVKGNGGLSFQLQVTGKRALLGLHLDGRSMEVALTHCLARLIGVQSEDTVVALGGRPDALLALKEVQRPRLVLGLSRRRQSNSVEGPGLSLARYGDPMPLSDASVNCALGVGYDGRTGVEMADLAEIARILQPGGVAVLLVRKPREFAAYMQNANYPFGVMAGLPINLRGRRWGVLLLERLVEFHASDDLLNIEWDNM